MHIQDSILKDFLIDSGVLSRGQIEAASERAEGKPLTRALIDGGVLSEDEVRRAAAHALGIPFVVLEKHDISPEALMLLPEPLCRAHNLAAYASDGQKIEVALLDIADLDALEPLKASLNLKIVPRLTTRESLRKALLLYQKTLKDSFGEKLLQENDPHRALQALLRHATLQHASEMHIRAAASGISVRYRIGAHLHEAMHLPKSAAGIVSVIRALANIGSKTLPQEGRFSLDLGSGKEVVARVSSVPSVGGDTLRLRLMAHNSSSKGFTLEGLGLHGKGAEALRAALYARSGIILVSGEKGSGRTTLLYTLLDMQNAPHLSLSSVETKVGQRLPYVAQTERNDEAGLSAAAALRATLRLDPDIVMVDSIEDRDTLALALSAAQRGVFVLLGIEAADVAEALKKMQKFGATESDLARIRCAVAVSLVRRLCQKQTRDTRTLERRHLESLESRADFASVLSALKEEGVISKDTAWKEVGYSRVTGCSECDGGYEGKVGLFEVVSEGEPFLNLFEDALYKAASGVTSVAEVLRFAQERELVQ